MSRQRCPSPSAPLALPELVASCPASGVSLQHLCEQGLREQGDTPAGEKPPMVEFPLNAGASPTPAASAGTKGKDAPKPVLGARSCRVERGHLLARYRQRALGEQPGSSLKVVYFSSNTSSSNPQCGLFPVLPTAWREMICPWLLGTPPVSPRGGLYSFEQGKVSVPHSCSASSLPPQQLET